MLPAKKTICSFLILLFTTLFFSSAGYSDVPLMINYQGRLTDDSGTPLNGTYQASFYCFCKRLKPPSFRRVAFC